MRLLLSVSSHFKYCKGRLYSMELMYSLYASRYLDVFDEVVILARASEADGPPEDWHEVTGPGVSFVPLPDYLGPWQFLRARSRIKEIIEETIPLFNCFALRVPCDVGTILWQCLRKRGIPFVVEVVGDPWLSLGPGSIRSLARPLARRFHRRVLRRQCREAVGALYLTKSYLQEQYPPGPETQTVVCSEAFLPPFMFARDLEGRLARLQRRAAAGPGAPPLRLGYIGTFNALYKAPDIHIRAMALLKSRGVNVELHMVGGGPLLEEMKTFARAQNVEDCVRFVGRLPGGEAVARYLDEVDLFLNASRQEGLPRALLEAMARGCPAIGSRVAGIPELLPDDLLVEPADAEGLADKIREVAGDAARLIAAAKRNFALSQEYAEQAIQEHRRDFYLAHRRRCESRSSVVVAGGAA